MQNVRAFESPGLQLVFPPSFCVVAFDDTMCIIQRALNNVVSSPIRRLLHFPRAALSETVFE